MKSKLYTKLQDYFDHSEDELEILFYVKSALLIIIGVLATNATRQFIDSSISSGIFFSIGAIISFIFYYNLEKKSRKRNKKFPLSILDNLKAEDELDEITKEFGRKKTIDTFVNNSIKSLNLNTCKVEYGVDQEICKQGLNEGLASVIDDIVNRPNSILNSTNSKFTIGLYLEYIAQKQTTYFPGAQVGYREEIILLRDDLNVGNQMPHNIHDTRNSEGLKHTLQVQFSNCYNHNKFTHSCVDIEEIGHTLIVSPIQAICESPEPSGLIFIIADDQFEIKDDLPNVMQIFGRIIANWVDKYNNCIHSHFENLKREEMGINEIIRQVESQEIQCCPVEPPPLTEHQVFNIEDEQENETQKIIEEDENLEK